MPDCNKIYEIYDVGCFTHCGDIDTGLIANYSGIHTLVFTFRSTTFIFKEYARKGQTLKINNYFNEDAETTFKVFNPDGTRYIFNKWHKWAAHCSEHDTFRIKIKIGKVIEVECFNCCTDLIVCTND